MKLNLDSFPGKASTIHDLSFHIENSLALWCLWLGV